MRDPISLELRNYFEDLLSIVRQCIMLLISHISEYKLLQSLLLWQQNRLLPR